MRKKCTALLLAAVMILSMIPVSWAADDNLAKDFSVTVAGDKTGDLKLGETRTLTATVTPLPTGTTLQPSNHTYTFESSDEQIIKVGNPTHNGFTGTANIEAVGYGSATITVTVKQARLGTKSVTYDVNVPAPTLRVSPSSSTLNIGDTKDLEVTVQNVDSDVTVTWGSDDPDVANITGGSNRKVTITAKKPGKAVITAEYEYATGKKATGTCQVEVREPSLSLNPGSNINLPIGQTRDITATLSNGKDGDTVTWEVTPSDVVDLAKNGNQATVTAKTPGEATLKASYTYEDKTLSKEVKITVPKPAIAGLPQTDNVPEGETKKLNATIQNGAPGSYIIWSSSNSAAVTVDQEGNITAARQSGQQAVITAAYSADPSIKMECTVTIAKSSFNTSLKVALDPASFTFPVGGGTRTISAKVYRTSLSTGRDEEIANPTLTWAVIEGGDVISISPNGKLCTVTPLKEGTAKIKVTAASNQITGETECEVTVHPESTELTVTLDPSPITVESGRRKQVTVTVTDNSGSVIPNATLAWSVADNDIATVSNAYVSGVKQGKTTLSVTATYNFNGKALTQTATCDITVVPRINSIQLSSSSATVEPNGRPVVITATPDISGGTINDVDLIWSSDDAKIVTMTTTDALGLQATLQPQSPGTTQIYASIGEVKSPPCNVEVSGILLLDENGKEVSAMTLAEQESKNLPKYQGYGSAKGSPTWQSSDPSTVQITGGGTSIKGLKPGTAIITARSGSYEKTITVTVSASAAATITRTITASSPLNFSDLASELNSQSITNTTKGLDYLTSLNVSTSEGTLYYKYASEAEPGEGVAQNGMYYLNPGTGQKGLRDISFVVNPYYTGGTATITYTGVAGTQRFNGKIVVTVRQLNNNITLRTSINTPLLFTGAKFNEICQRATGAPLSYVTFALPAENRGVLYSNYISPENYGSKLAPSTQCTQSMLDELTFVPASGWTGEVTLYYTGYSVGTTNNRYSGQVTITVSPQNSTGDLNYRISQNGRVTFDDADFNDYCRETLSNGNTLRWVKFDALPDSSQGTLYYNWSSSSRPGSRVYAGDSYYYGTATPRLDRVTFAAAEGFAGTVSIPFTGQDTAGNRFSGTVEISVGNNGGEGTVHYSCTPGRTVRFDNKEFNNLCRDLTGRTLRYIAFDALPGREDGVLYHNRTASTNGTRVTTRTRYYNSSSPYIDNLYFQADKNFSGEAEIPFTGYDLDGDSFSGTVIISSSGAGGADSQDLSYSVDYESFLTFDEEDFNDLCQWETDHNLNYVTFELPSSSQGTLYYNYRESSSSNTKVQSGNRYYRSSTPRLEQVSFVPKDGYTGTVYLDFTAYATDGSKFKGTVDINVTAPPADITVRYNTHIRPVNFRTSDFSGGGRYNLTSVRIENVPSVNAGYLFYEYSSPTQYTRQVSAGTTYQISDTGNGNRLSQVTFVPRAGYEGSFTLPFTGTTTNNRSVTGEIIIQVSPSYGSSSFNDLGAYSSQAQAAANYLYENNIASGVAAGQYGPENSIRRGDFALMVYKAFNLSSYNSGQSYFQDVTANDYYSQAVNTLYSLGIVSGTGGSSFSPRGTLSRQDAMLMVQKAMQSVGWNAPNGDASSLYNYSDNGDIAGYAQGAMSYMVRTGLLPTSGGRLSPREPLTRIDMAQVIHRALTY